METLTPMNIRIPSPYSPTSTELFDWEVFLREAFSLVNKMAIIGKTNIVNTAEYATDAEALQKAIDTGGVLYVRKGASFTIGGGVMLPSSGYLKIYLEDTATLNIDVSLPQFLGLTVIGGSDCTVNINATQTVGTDWLIKLENSAYVTISQTITLLGLFVLTANSGVLSQNANILKNVNGSVILEGWNISLASNKKLLGVTGTHTAPTGFAILRRIILVNTVSRSDWSLHLRYYDKVVFEDCHFEERVAHGMRTIQADVTNYLYFVRCRFKTVSFSNPPSVYTYAKEVYFFQCSGVDSLIRVYPANNFPAILSEHCSLFVFDCIFETQTATGNYGVFYASTVSGDKGVKVFCKRTFFRDRRTGTNSNASYGFVVEDPLVISLDDVVAENIGLFGTVTAKSFSEPSSISVNNCEVRDNKWVAMYLDCLANVSVTNCRFLGADLYDDTTYYGNVFYGTCIYANVPSSHYSGFEWTSSINPAIWRFENNDFKHYPRNAIRLRYSEYTSIRPFYALLNVTKNSFELISYKACISSGNYSSWESANGQEEGLSVATMFVRNIAGSGSNTQKMPFLVGNVFVRCFMSMYLSVPNKEQVIANNVIYTHSEHYSYYIQIKIEGDSTCNVYLVNTCAPILSPNTVKASNLFTLFISGWVGYSEAVNNSLYSNVSKIVVSNVSSFYNSGSIADYFGKPNSGTLYPTVWGKPYYDFHIVNGVAYGWVPAMFHLPLRLPSGLQSTTIKQVEGINYPAYPVSATDFVYFNTLADLLGSYQVPVGRSSVYVLLYWENIPSQQTITLQLEKRNLTNYNAEWVTVSNVDVSVNGTSFGVVPFATASVEFLKREVYRFKLQANPTGGLVYILYAQMSSLYRQVMYT